ncbi:MAG: sodium:solute symporter [Candidatus Thermoplasmatota archaeon]|nr:sodium:solute symporter [Candidatus Thermoplasmatota archaeon]
MNYDSLIVFIVLFVVFAIVGFLSSRFRRGNGTKLNEWSLAGRKLGAYLAWFLVGGDLYTAYTFIAVPSAEYAKGSIYMFATPYVMATFAVALITMTTLWKMSRKNNYFTGVDFVKDKYKSTTLAILIALTGIVAELPYIALQIVGMKAVLQVLFAPFLHVTATAAAVDDIALIVSFAVLAAFTFWSGLRGAALTAVMKDGIILSSVIVVVIAVPLTISGGFHHAFQLATTMGSTKAVYPTLSPKLTNAYISLFVLSALALYLYPHAINGVLGSKNVKAVRFSTAMLPLYGLGLFLLTIFGVLVFAVPKALSIVGYSSPTSLGNGSLVVPALISATMPQWFVGYAFLGIFIGGLVPAAIMAISQANLLTRNIIAEFRKDLTEKTEANIARWASVGFIFLALAFVFLIPATYAISLQLLGGILITQTLPPIFVGMYTKFLDKNALIAGWVAGIGTGVYFVEAANNFGSPTNSLMSTPFGLLYVAAVALFINLVVVFIWSLAANTFKRSPSEEPQKA